MDELLEFYCELDEVYYFLERALSEMFLYESQPFEYDYQISLSERDKLRDDLSDPTITGELSDEDFMEICERERIGEEEVCFRSRRAGTVDTVFRVHTGGGGGNGGLWPLEKLIPPSNFLV